MRKQIPSQEKMDCVLKVYKDKEFYLLGFRFVDLENSGYCATVQEGIGVLANNVSIWSKAVSRVRA